MRQKRNPFSTNFRGKTTSARIDFLQVTQVARFLSSHHAQHTQIFRARVLQSSEHRSPRYTCTYTERVLHSPAKHLFCPREKTSDL